MRVLVAFDKFKDSISAQQACDLAAAAILSARGGWELDPCPLTDGGEGFAEILTRSAEGASRRLDVTGPRGGRVAASFGVVPVERIPERARAMLGAAAARPGGAVAVVEMASASGLALLAQGERDLTRASSVGTGELIRAAAAAGARAVLLGVGGSASHDLGLGALSAMGIRFEGAAGEALGAVVPADWGLLRGISGRIPEGFPPILIACDVDNPLLGRRGALAVYGPQKGLKAADAAGFEAQTRKVASMVCRHFGRPEELSERPGAGAAGGIAFGLLAAADATLLPGFDLVSAWIDLEDRLSAADLVVTGEGRFDESSLSGKGPGTVARRALAQGKIVHVFAGEVALARRIPGLFTHAITPQGMALADALERAPRLLTEAVELALSEG
jgi:glycerate 2-kinase